MYRLSLRIEGDITIEAFRDALGNFLQLLREVEESVAGERSVRWTLESLRHGSPAIMTWRGSPRPQRRKRKVETIKPPDYAPLVGRALLSGVRKLELGQGRPESFTDEALDATLNLARVKMRRGITAVDLIGEGDPAPEPIAPEQTSTTRKIVVGETLTLTDSVNIALSEVVGVTERVAASVNEIIGPRYTAPGSVEGALQAINSRGLLYFVIYDSVFAARVRCDIPPKLKSRALSLFDERVLVTGMVARDSEGHPRHIKVDNIESIRPEELPTSIRGLDPDFTGGVTSSQYVKRGWSANG